jgi:hypothetical protein
MRAEQLTLRTPGKRPAAEAPGRLFGGLSQLRRGVRIAARQPSRCFLKRQSGCPRLCCTGQGCRCDVPDPVWGLAVRT